MKKKLLAVTLLSIVSANVMAQSNNKETGPYVELGLIQANYNEPALSFNHAMGSLKAGYNINKNFAVEGMYAGNLNSSSGYIGAVYVTAQVQNAYGIYGKAKLDLNDTFAIYVKAGATNGTVSASASSGGSFASAWSSGTSPSFGAGVQANISKDIYASLDYLSYYSRNGVTIAGPSINVGYKF
jgi:hypothetical protein